MIKAILRRMPLVLLLMVLLGTYAFADFGPKPSVVVEFKNCLLYTSPAAPMA